jgi:hypothetical protein
LYPFLSASLVTCAGLRRVDTARKLGAVCEAKKCPEISKGQQKPLKTK